MMDGEDDEGRTVVRGAPKIVKRGSKRPPQMDTKENVPTTLSPAAVIKQTLESAYAAKSERLMPGPPADLLPDPPEHPADGPGSTVLMPPSARSQPPPMIQGVQAINLGLQQTIHGAPPSRPVPSAPHSYPPPPHSYPPSNPYSGAPVPSGSVSVPGMAMSASAPMPAHFMNPNPPYSDGRIDPPGTSVTSRNRVVGRPAMSWAAALLAFGLLVGVGAVAVMQGSADGLVDTTASFVDPARAGQKPAAAAQPAPVPQPAATDTTAAAPQPPPQPAPPPVAAPPPPQPTVVAASTPPAPVADPPAKPDKPEKPAKPARRTFAAAAAPPPPRPAPAPAAPAADDDTKTAAAAKPQKPTKPAKGGSDDDAETKKALEQLQKAQLESSLQ